MITVKYYEVGDYYDIDGRGPWKAIGKFTKLADANKFAIKKGNYGRHADVRQVELNIAESIDDHENMESLELAQNALRKLSQEQIAALVKHYELKLK